MRSLRLPQAASGWGTWDGYTRKARGKSAHFPQSLAQVNSSVTAVRTPGGPQQPSLRNSVDWGIINSPFVFSPCLNSPQNSGKEDQESAAEGLAGIPGVTKTPEVQTVRAPVGSRSRCHRE